MDEKANVVLAIDVGGSHVKIKSSAGGDERRSVSGPKMDAAEMADAIDKLADGLAFDVVAIGFPGPVIHNRILSEPHNLAPGWVGFDFGKRFGKPVRIGKLRKARA